MHDDEPDTKKVIRDDGSDEDGMAEDLDTMSARKKDEEIVCQAILGKNLHDIYSVSRIKLAVDRQTMESLKGQMSGVDVMEVFSPERVGKLCEEYGLDQGKAMDFKSGSTSTKPLIERGAGMPSSRTSPCW